MNTVFARTVVALCLVALPASAFASAKDGAPHHSVAKKEGKKAAGKRHGHKASAPKHAASKKP